jgi:hypothetical protein
VVGVITSVIPEPVRIAIRGYWESLKVTMKRLWSDETTEKAEMIGWGVEEAQERHEEKASTFATTLHLTRVESTSGATDTV